MRTALNRLAFVCGLGLVAACSSTPAQKDGGPFNEDGSPGRGEIFVMLPEAGDLHDAPEAGDGSLDGNVAEGGDVAAMADADAAPEVAPDLAPDLPHEVAPEKPPSDLVNGMACQVNSWCRSKFCVDGFCCNTACEADSPMRCNACSMAKTGQKDGTCAADRSRERMKCGDACGQVLMNVPAVLSMICQQGQCVVPAVPDITDTCRKQFDACTTSFCDQPTNRTARCVHTLCPQGGTCCCEMPGNPTARSCMATNACRNDRMCVSQ